MMLQLLVYLFAMIIVAPLSKRFGLGAVLGYLVAGVLLGPHALGLIADSAKDASHLAEFGVIMMLFIIGLELNPRVLWRMRGPIFGLGGAQVTVTSLLFAAVALAAGLPWQSALAVGMVLSVSSTAIVMQSLAERGFAKAEAGERAFAVLLFQDMAVIPMLAIFPLLSSSLAPGADLAPEAVSGWKKALLVAAAIGGLIVAGRFLVRPVFRALARMKLRETFTAMALLIVVGTTALMDTVGVSAALGAFLAGVLLADSEFRHQIEADIEPFKGLLLGLFFISIGAGIDLALPVARPFAVFGTVVCLVVLKAGILMGLGRVFRMNGESRFLLGASLAQGGEFAFVLLGYATTGSLLSDNNAQILTAAVAISMGLAPLLIAAAIRWGLPLYAKKVEEREPDKVDEQASRALVLGIGRFGQVVVRLLRANGFQTTALDYDAEQIEAMERFGIKGYFGDASRMDLLEAAGIGRLGILVVAIDDQEAAVNIVKEVREHFPSIKIFARAFDRVHGYKLYNAGADQCTIETGWSAVFLGTDILRALGFPAWRAHRQGIFFGRYNERTLREMAPKYGRIDRNAFVLEAREKIDTLETLLRAEQRRRGDDPGDRAWESGPRAADQGERDA